MKTGNVKVFLNTEDFKPPDDGEPYFLVAGNGIFLHRENDCFSACVKVDDRMNLREHEESVEWKLPPIDTRIAHTVINFARYIRNRLGTECLLWIYYSFEKGKYLIHVPKQKATSGSVTTSDATPAPEDYRKVGTIHSHPGRAFHSEGDMEDESYSDGIHFVIGHLEEDIPEICSTIVIHGKRFQVDYREFIDLNLDIPRNWLDKIRKAGND